MLLKPPKKTPGEVKDPYDTGFYRVFKGFLRGVIRARWLTVAIVIAIFVASLWGFGFIEQSFFPPSTRPQMMVDFWMPQGTHIEDTGARVAEIEGYLLEQEGVTHVSSLLGKGGLRFLLTYTPEKLNSSYAQMLVDVDDAEAIDRLIPAIESYLAETYPEALAYASPFQLGPGSTGKIQARFSGPDADVPARGSRARRSRFCTPSPIRRRSAPTGARGSRCCDRRSTTSAPT